VKDTGAARQALADYLTDRGIPAVTAWTQAARKGPGQAVCAVSLRGMEGGAPGFQDYLGERYDEESGTWEELYGKRLELTFGLDLLGGSAEQVQAGLDLLTAALEAGGPVGMRFMRFSAGECAYDAAQRRYVCPVQATAQVWSRAVAQEGGAFLDFTVEGENRG